MLKIIQMETTNLCQGKCIFCPHSQLSEFGTMEQSLYEKILKEASQLPPLQKFIPMGTGEPMMDEKIIPRIKLARKMLHRQTLIEFYTNGSLLTKKIIDKLVDVKSLHISISLNGACTETRKKLMGLDDFDHVMGMICYLAKRGMSYSVTLLKEPFIKREELLRLIDTLVNLPGRKAEWYGSLSNLNFAGAMFEHKRNGGSPCARAIEHLTVMWNGQVNLCCMDYSGRKNFGDLNKNSILEVWRSPERQKYIRYHLEGRGNELPLCEECNCADVEECAGCDKEEINGG